MKPLMILSALLVSIFLQASEKDGGWVVKATDYHASYVGAPVANGCIGILPWKEPFSVTHVILNHVFEKGSQTGVSRVLQGLNPFCLDLLIDGQPVAAAPLEGWEQQLNLRAATHTTSFRLPGQAEVTYTLRALRNLPYAGLMEVRVKALRDLHLQALQQTRVPTGYSPARVTFSPLVGSRGGESLMRVTAATAGGTHTVSAASYLQAQSSSLQPLVDVAHERLTLQGPLKAGEEASFTLLASICTTRDFDDPLHESCRQLIYAQSIGLPQLLRGHQQAWDRLWQSDIQIEGDDEAQQQVRLALYHLYSFGRAHSRLSISPMGLSSQGYNGHVFWDAELWMYPPLLMLQPDLARAMLDYRLDRLPAAARRAYAYGYQGVMYPWESDDAGDESTPLEALTGPFEHHVTADVALAAWHYYCVTQDRAWLQREGYPLLEAVAQFWVSRVTPRADGRYSIVNVVGADEYACGVTDNAFTNAAAACALRCAVSAARLCGQTAPKEWGHIADHLAFHYFPDGVTREYEGYDGQLIKQADVNLLGYPLGCVTDPAQLRKDMDYYRDKIDPDHGPAMSYSVFSVQYARMGDAAAAYEMFQRCYRPNLRAPFGVMAETPTSQNPYFATGAGGLLQAVIHGFGGLTVTDKGIQQIPSVLPPHWKKLTLTGVGPKGQTYVRYGARSKHRKK